jgi:hypothetical protein
VSRVHIVDRALLGTQGLHTGQYCAATTRNKLPISKTADVVIQPGLMLVICAIQVAVWRRAMASWSGRRLHDLHAEAGLS